MHRLPKEHVIEPLGMEREPNFQPWPQPIHDDEDQFLYNPHIYIYVCMYVYVLYYIYIYTYVC